MADVIIPPWVLPESPETLRWIDDATQAFPPVFGRGMTQRGSMADPRWGLRRRYRGLRSDQKAAILTCLNESRGQFNRILVAPHTPLRGSFPTSELLANGIFPSGTTGWSGTGAGVGTIAVNDRVLRVPHAANGAAGALSSTVTVVQYAPYVGRTFFRSGRYLAGAPTLTSFFDDTGSLSSSINATSDGLVTGGFVPATTSARAIPQDAAGSTIANDHFEVSYVSLSRCALIDGGGNSLLRSDEFDNAAWTKGRSAATANAATAPDGATTAEAFVEDNTTGDHYFTTASSLTIPAAATDLSVGVAAKLNGRNFIRLMLRHAGGDLYQTFNLSTGAVGATSSAGTGWGNLRAHIVALGNGWYECHLTGRKTGAQTAVDVFILSQNADSAATYLGTSGTACFVWRATFSQSSVPSRLVQTTSAAITASGPIGGAAYLKGLPASTSGLLLVGDWIEVASQLKQVTAPLNSDAAGLGYLQFRPALGDSPADNDPVIINQPFGRFIYSGGQKEMENQFGIYGDIEMNLEEVYS